jgi:hypothetical protein
MQKPHRFVLDRFASYADEAGAFVRRRRLRSKPFARVWRPGGSIVGLDPAGTDGRRLEAAADELIALVEPER